MIGHELPRRLPNFFIVGAPKCGTTAISHYLRTHPQVFFSDPKEPYYFCKDFPQLARNFGITEWGRYCSLFSGASNQQKAVGEGSTLYLASKSAISDINRALPSAKLIAVVRDPVALVASFHRHLLKLGLEDQQDLRVAWDLQEARRQGRSLPRRAPAPELLDYRHIASMGTQLLRFCAEIPAERRLIIRYEEFTTDPATVYARLLRFLELDQDDRMTFDRINESGTPRSRFAVNLLQSRTGRSVVNAAKALTPSRYRMAVASIKERLIYARVPAAVTDKEVIGFIAGELSDEKLLVAKALGE